MSRRRRAILSCGAIVVAVACSSSSTRSGSTDGGVVQQQGDAPLPGTPVWKPTSARIQLTVTNKQLGAFGYDKVRADLSESQLRALDGMRTMAPNHGGFTAFVDFVDITITDRDGSRATFQATGMNFHSGGADGQPDGRTPIDYRTIEPFLASMASCQKSLPPTARRRTTMTRLDPSEDGGAGFPSPTELSSDFGCLHGTRLAGGCSDVLFRIVPPNDGSFTFSVHQCVDVLSLRLFSGDGKTMLEEAALGGSIADACVALSRALSVQESYLLMLTRTTPDCLTGEEGDVFVRMQPTEE